MESLVAGAVEQIGHRGDYLDEEEEEERIQNRRKDGSKTEGVERLGFLSDVGFSDVGFSDVGLPSCQPCVPAGFQRLPFCLDCDRVAFCFKTSSIDTSSHMFMNMTTTQRYEARINNTLPRRRHVMTWKLFPLPESVK